MLRVHDIEYGIDPILRKPAVRLVLAGCALRCVWCDVPETHFGGAMNELGDILQQVAHYPTRRVIVTGGEPLAQEACPTLMTALCDGGHEAWLDTSGSIDLKHVDPRARLLVDVKCPGSGMVAHNVPGLPGRLRAEDRLVFTLLDRYDYEWAKSILVEQSPKASVSFTMARGVEDNGHACLSDWVMDDGLDVECLT